jgi:hypothetical protein
MDFGPGFEACRRPLRAWKRTHVGFGPTERRRHGSTNDNRNDVLCRSTGKAEALILSDIGKGAPLDASAS